MCGHYILQLKENLFAQNVARKHGVRKSYLKIKKVT
jgi:hypothetical protein